MKRLWQTALVLALLVAPLAVLLTSHRSHEARAATPQSPPAPGVDVAALRARGPDALAPLFAQRETLLARLAQAKTTEEFGRINAELQRLSATIDAVGGARYCTASRFFWHTDLDAAKAAAAKSGKPILSLRMMGQLTEEFSCANSRFFRTTLYANEEISQYLRDNYVLHWKSVRPVPKVTVDFGDGRKLERTLTGNSAHYILDVDGQPLDVLPGLYSPQKFLVELQRVHNLFAAVAANRDKPDARQQMLRVYHEQLLRETVAQWSSDLRQIEMSETLAQLKELPPNGATPNGGIRLDAIPAAAAAEIAVPKGRVEMPLIRQIVMEAPQLEQRTDDVMWEKIAALHAAEWKLDEASVRLIRSENPNAAQAGRLARTKRLVEDPLVKMIVNLESSIALDTVRNEYQLRRRIHEWYGEQQPADVEELNNRVYAELFLTPNSDPWIGLVPDDTYTALSNGGVVRAK
jgi:hypothetical protein